MKPISKQQIPAFLRKWKGDRSILGVCRELEISPQTFHLWLRGDGFPNDEHLRRMGYRWVIVANE